LIASGEKPRIPQKPTSLDVRRCELPHASCELWFYCSRALLLNDTASTFLPYNKPRVCKARGFLREDEYFATKNAHQPGQHSKHFSLFDDSVQWRLHKSLQYYKTRSSTEILQHAKSNCSEQSVCAGLGLAGAGPNARPKRGTPLSSDFMTSLCSVNRVMIVVERRYTVKH